MLLLAAHACLALQPFHFNLFVRCIADRLQVDEPVTTVPTIGFNVETLKYKNIQFQARAATLNY
jgi:hypothetical protein